MGNTILGHTIDNMEGRIQNCLKVGGGHFQYMT
jgi:hypothetical protein